MRTATPIVLSEEERDLLLRWARGRRTSVRLAMRAKLILAAADGATNKQIAQDHQTDEHTVARWRKRFVDGGIDSIKRDAPRPGRKKKLDSAIEDQILALTRDGHPTRSRGWSSRALADELGVSSSMVLRVWRAHGVNSGQHSG